MGCPKVLRDPFLAGGPGNKTVQYFGMCSLCLGEGGGGVGMLETSQVEIHWNCSPVSKTEGKAGSSAEFCADSLAHLKD